MMRGFRPFVFFFSIILFVAGISKAQDKKLMIGKPIADTSRSLFSKSFYSLLHAQDALDLRVGKFPGANLSTEYFFTPPSLNTIPQTTILEQDPMPTEKKSFVSLYLGGGLSNVDGGDLNRDIRDSNARYEALNEIGYEWINAMHWKEIKWMPHLKGEIIFSLFKNFGVGLGFEQSTKTNPRTSSISWFYYGGRTGGRQETTVGTVSIQGEHELTVQPVTLNLYYFIPAGRVAEFYLAGGVGYYMASLKFNGLSRSNSLIIWDLYSMGDFTDSIRYKFPEDLKDEYEAKSKAFGFQGGLGLDYRLSRAISLVVEGNYRIVNFKNWEGDRSYTENITEIAEQLSRDYSFETSRTESDAFAGKLWFYEYYQKSVGEWYGTIDLLEEEPEENPDRRNIREAEINFSGFVFRIGFKIRF